MSKEFKGTQGEWKIDLEYKSIERVQIIDSNNNGFIDVWKLGKITEEEMKANAKLISKAPEMLEMLEKLRGYGAEYGMPNKLYIELEQLIKEATEL